MSLNERCSHSSRLGALWLHSEAGMSLMEQLKERRFVIPSKSQHSHHISYSKTCEQACYTLPIRQGLSTVPSGSSNQPIIYSILSKSYHPLHSECQYIGYSGSVNLEAYIKTFRIIFYCIKSDNILFFVDENTPLY